MISQTKSDSQTIKSDSQTIKLIFFRSFAKKNFCPDRTLCGWILLNLYIIISNSKCAYDFFQIVTILDDSKTFLVIN